MGDRLQHIDLAGELEGVAIAAVGVEHDRVRRGDRARIIQPLVEELHLTNLLAPTVQPDIEPARRLVGKVKVGRKHEAIGLDRPVDPRAEATDRKPRPARGAARIIDEPGPTTALREGLEPSSAMVEEVFGMTDLFLLVEKTIFDSKPYRAGEHEHLGAVGIARRGDRSDVARQRVGRPEESLPRGVIEFNADWGNRTYCSG